jgi:hypothetical protein
MENTTPQPPKNNTMLGIGLFIAFLVIVYFLFFKSDNAATIDPKTGKKKDAKKDDTKKDDVPKPPDPDQNTPRGAECWNNKWLKKAASTDTFTNPTKIERELYLQDMLKYTEKGGYKGDSQLRVISITTAFLKGMDLSLTAANAEMYKLEINNFMTNLGSTIIRRRNFADEITEQIYKPGDLLCNRPTFSQTYLN